MIRRASCLLFCLLSLGASAQSATAPSEGSPFDLEAWKAKYGQPWALRDWMKHNPGPHRSYFGSGSDGVARGWWISLGPLGVTTRMHDRSWSSFAGFQKLFPAPLCDGGQLIYNCYQVEAVKPGAPAQGLLQKGDLILGFDGQLLQCAQNTYLGRPLETQEARGLDIHAGLLLDAAEGRGFTTATVLRLPPNPAPEILGALKGGRKFSPVPLPAGSQDIPLPAGTDKIEVRCRSGFWLRGEGGLWHDLNAVLKRREKIEGGLEVPPGRWVLHVESAEGLKGLSVAASVRPPLPAALKPYLREIRIPLPRIGSFGMPADIHGDKMRNMADLMAARLAAQQSPDGSWQAPGYGGEVFPSAISGLALLSTGDRRYEAQIRKCAHYCAYTAPADSWSYIQGTRLLFLAEYYLRSRDPQILPGLRKVVAETRRYVLADYTSGHGIGAPGYGGSGYIGGGGMIALGFAAASHTPAMDAADKALLDNMLMRVQEIAPGGKVFYGRSGKKEKDTQEGHSGSCGTGPYFLASLIRGGSANFVAKARERYSRGPYGDIDTGHATQTIHFTMGMLALASCGDQVYREALSSVTWYLTLMRDYDGSGNQNNYRVEYHNGDGVIGVPYWRTAGMILACNALKRNLATTGLPAARTALPKDSPQLYHMDAGLRRVLLGNWDLVDACLGQAAGPAFRQARRELAAMHPDKDFAKTFHAFVTAGSGRAALAEVLKQPSPAPEVAPGQLAELMLGISFIAEYAPDLEPEDEEEGAGADRAEDGGKKAPKADKKSRKQEQKRIRALLASGQVVELDYQLRLAAGGLRRLNPRFAELSPLPLEGLRVAISGLGADSPLKQRLTWNGGAEGRIDEFRHTLKMKSDARPSFSLDIAYRVAGLDIAYRARLDGPTLQSREYHPALVQIPVTGETVEDFDGQYALFVRLANGSLLPCENRMGKNAYGGTPRDFLPAGAATRFLISPDTLWGHDVRSYSLADTRARLLPYASPGRDSAVLVDRQAATGLDIGAEETVLELHLPQAAEIPAAYLQWSGGARSCRFESQLADGSWELLQRSDKNAYLPLPARPLRQLRLVIDKGSPCRLAELLLLAPAARRPLAPLNAGQP
ncbi:MAG: hypothetical protein RL095_3452 [Verrucomicrobiota bacterium]|jgi:hypothetical protein